MELIIILILVLLNGIFSMSEMALVSSRKFKLEGARKKGSLGAKTALELSEHPTHFLSTVQIGITLIGILLGVYSGENITEDVVVLLNKSTFLTPYAENIATGIVVIFITYLSIVFGELLPKRIAMTFPEPIISILSRPMQWLSILASPFVWFLSKSNNFFLSLFGITKTSESKVTEEEIKSIIKESAEGGEIEEIEHNIVERVFELGDRQVKSLCTHRSDLIYFTVQTSLKEIKETVLYDKHSCYPVSESQNLDDVIGVVLLKDLFSHTEPAFNIMKYLRQPVFINENMLAYKVLEIFKKEKMHYGLVVDEYGSVTGMVTMDDVVDALVGDVTELGQEEYSMVQRNDNSWLVDGQYSLVEFDRFFDLSLDQEIHHKYATVAGLVMYLSGKVPKTGDKCHLGELNLEVLDMDGLRIDKLLVEKNKSS